MREFFSQDGLYYRSSDIDPKKKTLFFIHGMTGSSSAWNEFEDRLQNTYNMVTIDLRGHGLSKKFKDYRDYEINSISEDIRKIAQNLGLKEIILVGHSFGTLVALSSLPLLSREIKLVVFLSPIFNVKKARLGSIALPIVSLFASIVSPFPFFPSNGGHVNYSKYRNTGDWNVRVFMADVANTSFRIFLFCMKHLYCYKNMETLLKEIKVPTLIIHGTKDSVMPVNKSRLSANQIANCRFMPLEGGNHVIVRDRPDIISNMIDDYINKQLNLN